jgi:gliding motility-associated-like protein
MKKITFLILAIAAASIKLSAQCISCSQGQHGLNDSSLVKTRYTGNGNHTLGQSYILQNMCGLNYVAAAAETTTRPSWQPGSGFPVTVNLNATGCVQQAYLYWEASYTEATAPTVTATFTNTNLVVNTVPSVIIGTDGSKCWGEHGTASYRADVTAFMSGIGNYTIDLTGFANKDYEVDGVFLIEVYTSNTATYSGSIALYDGCYTSLTGNEMFTLSGFNVCAATSTASSFGVFADMQNNVTPPQNEESFNGVRQLFPNNFYNYNTINVSLTTGQTTSQDSVYINDGGDCYNWSVAGLYWQNTTCMTCVPGSNFTLADSSTPSACALSDGSASIIATGGTSPYTYLWSNGATTSSVTGLAPGTYTVHIVDATGCNVDSATVIVKSDDSLSAPAIALKMVKCNGGNNGEAYVKETGGIGPFTYSWSNSATTDTVNNLTAGTYTVTTTDNSGCAFISSVNIVQPPPIKITIDSANNPKCHGFTDGDIIISVSGGGAPYTYAWSPVAGSGATLSNLTGGTYTVVVTDTNGCSTKDSVTITEPARMVPVVTGNDSVCKGSSVTLTATAPGATTWSWAPPATVSCPTCNSTPVTPTVTTTYTVTASNGTCTGDTTFTVNVKPLPVGSIRVVPSNDSICAGDSAHLIALGGCTYLWTANGNTADSEWVKPAITTTYYCQITCDGCSVGVNAKIVVTSITSQGINLAKDSICLGDSTTMTAFGGNKYKWLPPLNSTNATVEVKTAGTYSVVITTPCGIDTAKRTLHVFTPPVIGFKGNTVICVGGSTTWTASGGTSYNWLPNIGLSCNNCASTTVNPPSNVTYTLTVSNGRCQTDTMINLVVVNPPNAKITAAPPCICKGASTTLTASGGGTYKWNTGSVDSVITVSPTKDSTFTVHVTKGCTDSIKTTICVYAPYFSVCCDTTIQIGGSTMLTTFGSSGTMTYVWAPPTGLSCTTCPNPIATPTVTTTYTVTATDSNGCITERTVTVELACDDFTVPNIFTPNNDGINDDLVIDVPNYQTYSIQIFDRWGKLMYTSTDPKTYWNGRINGTDNLVPDGTYYYLITATCGENTYKKHGFVQVLTGK